eukprot:8456514-Alexandrium_andersonii.AAC.1
MPLPRHSWETPSPPRAAEQPAVPDPPDEPDLDGEGWRNAGMAPEPEMTPAEAGEELVDFLLGMMMS